MHELFSVIIDWYMARVNYGTVTLLMAIESSFIPLPSEIVVPPAAWKAAGGEMNIILVILCATVGAVCGASFNYFLSRTLGRAVLYTLADSRISHLFLVTREKLENAEIYFRTHGKSATFIGRLVPAVRHLISIPAGLSRMDLKHFLTYTALGACLWNIILAALGYFLYTQKDVLARYFTLISWTLLFIGIAFAIYLIVSALWSKRNGKSGESDPA